MASTTVQGVWVGKSQFDDAEKKFHSKVSPEMNLWRPRYYLENNLRSLSSAPLGLTEVCVCAPFSVVPFTE